MRSFYRTAEVLIFFCEFIRTTSIHYNIQQHLKRNESSAKHYPFLNPPLTAVTTIIHYSLFSPPHKQPSQHLPLTTKH